MNAITLEIEGLGIITGDEKRLLERVVPTCEFTQRKSYDEYYVKSRALKVDLALSALMILADEFRVVVHTDAVELERK